MRLGGKETQLIAEGGPVFAGISAGGERVAYLRPNASEPERPNPAEGTEPGAGPRQGEIFSYDTTTETTVEVGSGDEAVPVNVSADGSHVYFLSPAVLDGSENSQGMVATPPAQGHGTLAAGSAEVSGLSAETGAFAPGMQISGPGVPVGARIAAVDQTAEALTLSTQATASGPVQLSATAENLYEWDASGEAIDFIATVTQRDVYGKQAAGVNGRVENGLGLWTDNATGFSANSHRGPGGAPSRSSADGSVLLFESRARLTPYDNAGHSEIYRYEEAADELRCLSCTPTGVPPGGDALLQSATPGFLLSEPPVSQIGEVINLTADGRRAFFQSTEPLVIDDTDGLQDVYEWEAPAKGSCTEASPAFQASTAGCVYLISAGHSPRDDHLYGMTPDGSDVVFESGDLLSFEDRDRTPSLYDARVGGGFAPPPQPPGECLGEACQPALSAAAAQTPASSTFRGPGNLPARGAECNAAARKASKLSRRAKRLRRSARATRRSAKPALARKRKRKASRMAKRARKQSAGAKRCRRANRRAAR